VRGFAKRKLVEEIFGWGKTVGNFRKTRPHWSGTRVSSRAPKAPRVIRCLTSPKI